MPKPTKEQNLNLFLIKPSKINKSYAIKVLKELLSKVKNDELEESKKLDVNQRKEIISSILQRIEFLKEYYGKAIDKQGYKRIIISYLPNEIENLNQDLNLLQEYTQNPTLELKDLIKIKSLSKDTLNKEEVQNNQLYQQQTKDLLDTTQNLLRKVNGIATNINQIARIKNEARIFQTDYSLTKEEKEQLLNSTQELEEIILDLTNYQNKV
jgi:hypothetical protein